MRRTNKQAPADVLTDTPAGAFRCQLSNVTESLVVRAADIRNPGSYSIIRSEDPDKWSRTRPVPSGRFETADLRFRNPLV